MVTLSGPGRRTAAVLVLAALTVGTWWLFLGSDTTYQVDASGIASGPYEVPQVVCCAVALAVLTVAGTLLLPAWAVAVTVTAAFTAAWSIDAGSTDLTGLWVLGAMEVLAGTAFGSGLVAFATRAVTMTRSTAGH